MEFREVVRRRRMIRNYQPGRPVPPEVVTRLLSHAVRAPSAAFAQGWGFLALQEPEDLKLFWSVTVPDEVAEVYAPLTSAPLVIVPHSSAAEYQSAATVDASEWAEQAERLMAENPDAIREWTAGSVDDIVPIWHVDAGFATLMMLLTVVDEGLGATFFGFTAGRALRHAVRAEVARPHRAAGGRLRGALPDRPDAHPVARVRGA